MSTISTSFTAVGVSTGLLVVPNQTVTFGISGTYDATLVFEKTLDGGQTWTLYAEYSTPDATVSATVGDPGTYRWRCTSRTSGTAVATITGNAYQILFPAITNQAGETVFEVTSDGISTKTVTQSSPASDLTGFTGASNTGLGTAAGDSITSATGVVAVGVNAATATTSGASIVAIGKDALAANTTDSGNVAVGTEAAKTMNQANAHATAVGHQALKASDNGTDATAIGYKALTALTAGAQNTAVGSHAGEALTTGDNNVIVGNNALATGTTVTSTVAVGEESLYGSTGDKNTGVGKGSGGEITTGTGNAMIGYQAGKAQGNVSNKFMVGLGNGQGLIFSIDEMGNLLNIAVRYTDGTMKAIAPIALV